MSVLERLQGKLSGDVIGPDDDRYDDARRVYNAMIDRRPAAVVRPTAADDVATAVRAAADEGLAVAVRGGGHSVPGFGTADDAVVIDLSAMRRVDVDPATRTAHAQGGATWGDFNEATGAHGLATTGGILSTTGVGGLTLGGGIGYLARGVGLSCDNLVAAEVATADGRIVRASDDENADLFWALRGGSGNFGVVTSFGFRLHPVAMIYGGPMFFELEDAAAILRFYREFIADAPEELGMFPAFQIAPPLPFLPEERHGQTFLAVVACWAGPLEMGKGILKPLHDVAPVVAEHVGEMPYAALNSAFDALHPPGLRHYWKTSFATDLTDEAIEANLTHGPAVPVVNSTVHIYSINGAVQRVAPDATAFAYRDATFATVIAGMWPDPNDDDANIEWVRGYYDAIAPYSQEGGYINFMSADDQDKIRASYRQNYDRLVEVKRAWDPGNVFRVNQNIAP
ncbi:MAG TPA: FAD-binding oxidoreductase [Actinomycetota bacterium]|nr:FAD-binding oxidoreductase [Actinomycetota bacterium]